ncbi:MAG: leucyl/phenylalanyl-tRNA--protein transferase [Bacteriovoracaceae bacterium]
MAIVQFPPLELADESGLLAQGGDLEVPSLVLAYSQGIFPWPYSDYHPITWYSPDPRGILDYSDLHLSSSMKKFLKKNPYTVKFNEDFEEVILGCAASTNRKGQDLEAMSSTWITRKMIEAYIALFYAGHAHCVAVYEKDELVGGLYGVRLKKFYSGESMFYKKTNASKYALLSLMENLHQKGITWLDTQMVTPVVESLGGKEIARAEFLKRLAESLI